MKYKKIIHSMLVVVFLAQIQAASLPAYRNSSCLAVPSIFKEARIAVDTPDYQLIKINDEYYIYIDTSGNVIHIHKTREGWQGEHNGRQCTLALAGDGPVRRDIVVYLLKKDYRIEKIADTVIHLQQRERPPAVKLDEALQPEEIILREFQKVLDDFSEGGSTEVSEFKKIITRVLFVCNNIRMDTTLYTRESEKINAIKPNMKLLSSRIAEFLCSSKLELQLLGERLKDTIDCLSSLEGNVYIRRITSDMIFTLESSQLLLQKTVVEQFVIHTLLKDFRASQLFLKREEETEIEGTWTINLKTTGKEIVTCAFSKKKSGVQFGTNMLVTYKEGGQSKKYFIKSHQCYPIARSESAHTGFSSIAPKVPDLKEIFVYKMLDRLGLGAKIHFVTNPYARSGLFIVSEDVSETAGVPFKEAAALEAEEESLKEMLRREGAIRLSTPLKIALNQFDLLGRIFNLTDFHSSNFGSVTMPTGEVTWKMVDFRVGEELRETSAAEFLSANSRFNYREGGILAGILKGRKSLEKLKTGMDAMDDLREARMFETQLEETCKEIVTYLQTGMPQQGLTVAEVLGLDVPTARTRLEEYKGYVRGNFRTMYDGLEPKYVEEFKNLLMDEGKFSIAMDREEIRFDHETSIFIIPRRALLISAGMIVTLLGGDYLKCIVTAIIEYKMRSSRLSDSTLLSQWMEALDALRDVHDVEKIEGLFGILRVIGREEFIMPDLAIINFPSMRHVITAA